MAAEGASQLTSVVALLGAAIIAVPIFKRIGLGSVLGYLAGGLAIGPFGFGLFSDPHTILHVAELGVVMFLFLVGLEMQPAHLGLTQIYLRLGQFSGDWRGNCAHRFSDGIRLFLASGICQCLRFCTDFYGNRDAGVKRTKRNDFRSRSQNGIDFAI